MIMPIHNFLTLTAPKDKLFKFDVWVAPIHLGAHWAMLVRYKLENTETPIITHMHTQHTKVVDLAKKTIWYSDSMDCNSGIGPDKNDVSEM